MQASSSSVLLEGAGNLNSMVNLKQKEHSQTTVTKAEASPLSHQGTKTRKCKFFFSNKGCALGNECKFSHAIVEDTKEESAPTQPPRPPCKFYIAGYCKWGNRCGFFHDRRVQTSRAKGGKTTKTADKKLSELSDSELKVLRKTEIEQLKKRFPKRSDVDNMTYRLVFRVTDPDWPFDVKSLNLEFQFPELYPKHIMKVCIYDNECLPDTLSRYLIHKMNDWLVEQLEASRKSDKANMIFRPFLRWIDKSLEQFFTNGLLKYKRELAAKAAGLTFVHHTELKSTREDNSGSECEATPEDEGKSESSNELSRLDLPAQMDALTVTAKPTNQETPMKPSPTTQPYSKLNPPRRGTELRLKHLQLTESTATLHCTVARIGLRCSRCKTVHHVSLLPEKPYVVVCDKCRSKMSLIFHPNLMHMSSNTAGFFDLELCQLFDLVLQDCQFVAGCLECNKENLVHGLQQEQQRSFWCISCHKKMSLSLERGSYVVLNEGAAIKIGADAVVIAKKAKPKDELRILADGKPLPDFGACKHYKKSFRWFRFPCCGKLYPCDKCHDEKEVDHEMDMANRMVCGYCSKEQGFSLTKPCISCDASLTRAKSQHWEGGQGCRNKLNMAKGDKQKFAGSNKTISKKATAVQKKTGKKTTHMRHTT